MTTMLEEIKQRDELWFNEDEPAHEDRRWLLARVESLSTALNGMIGGFSMDWTGTPLGDRIDAAKKALASLTTPVSSHSEEQS